MSAERGDHAARENARVNREEPRERLLPVVRSADDDALETVADEGYDAEQTERDLRCPVAFLVPRQLIAAERDQEHKHEQDEADPEIEFARRLVGPGDDHLHEMRDQQGREDLRQIMMEPAQ